MPKIFGEINNNNTTANNNMDNEQLSPRSRKRKELLTSVELTDDQIE